ncbi:MAG: PaaI family thioesterase [Xanthobacteraceae bacterium]
MVSPRPVDPDFVTRVRSSFDRQGFMGLLGATLTRIEPGSVEIEVPFRADLTQQHGYFHAGVTSAVADTAGGYAGYTLFPAGSSVLTVEFKINLIAPAQGNRLSATGRVVKHGRTLTICAFEVYKLSTAASPDHETDRRTLCATGMQTLICLHGRGDG